MSPRLQSETARQRELYKYWQPNESIFPSADYDESFNRDYQPRPSYDSALTAYAQLGALRCNAKRGIVSVVDQNWQYIIAEGTKTLSLQDGSVIDEDDQLWFGLRTIPRSMGICARALTEFCELEAQDEQVPDLLFEPMQFIIPDLSKDPRFAPQPFVCGTPYLRFYAGVPIRSPAGYIIGVYTIVDDKPRYDFGERDLNILKDLAATVMDHLVLNTVRGRHHRADRMVKGLGLFVEGKSTLRDWWLRSGHLAKGPATKSGDKGEWTLKAQADAEFGPQQEATPQKQNRGMGHPDAVLCTTAEDSPTPNPIISRNENNSNIIQPTKSETKDAVNLSLPAPPAEDPIIISPTQNSVSSDSTRPEDNTHLKEPENDALSISQDMAALLKRASNLIRESIAVEGCLFLDTGPEIVRDTPLSPGPENRESSTATKRMSFRRKSVSETEGILLDTAVNGTTLNSGSSYFRSDSFHESTCTVLGYSLKFQAHFNDGEKPKFKLPVEFLHRLFDQYPDGSILNFEDDGTISSSEEDPDMDLSSDLMSRRGISKPWSKKTKRSFKELDARIIRATFPGIRCLAFFPLWDTSTNSWFCGALAWTNDPLRVLDPDDDMAYLAAFGNSIMAEKARLDASMADRMKGNFISTVSHELRSPLHGILASAELLKDMSTSAAQIDVISMINVCGRTLLDTINHVLDFTELNRLRKPKSSEKGKPGDRDSSKKKSRSAYSMTNQIANLDLSMLVEEVVESTLAGYDFGQSEVAAMASSDSQLTFSGLGTKSPMKNALLPSPGRINVVVDIQWRSSWVFSIQPGAWRRILMNLFGNALKYTKTGHICVSLKSISSVSDQDSRPSIILTVSDTGKGISKQFQKHHLFTPFVQEDTLATGTGLGLSIVQQIVHDLDGQIDVKSEEGFGTKVTVQIPLELSGSSEPSGDNASLQIVCQRTKGLKVFILPSAEISKNEEEGALKTQESDTGCIPMEKSLRNVLINWFEMDVIDGASSEHVEADIYLLSNDQFRTLATEDVNGNLTWEPRIIQLVKDNALIILSTSPASTNSRISGLPASVPIIQQPFGPQKLARVFNEILNKKVTPVQPKLLESESANINGTSLESILKVSEFPAQVPSSATIQETEISVTVDMNLISTKTTSLVIQSPETLVQSQQPTILLVEDNEINLKLLIMYMRKLKYSYQIATNGLEALQTFQKNPLPLRVILMDISMPIMDGMEATREIRRHEREMGLPPATIIALTGASSVNAQEKAIASGFDRFLTKPVPLNLVRDIVTGWEPNEQYQQPT